MSKSTRVTEKGQTTIPKELREKYDLKPGDEVVRGVTRAGNPEETRQALLDNGPVSLAPVEDEATREYATTVSAFSIHDGLVVASHRARETDGVITSHARIADAGIETVRD